VFRKFTFLSLVALLAMVVGAGCGGSDDSDLTLTTSSLTKAEYIKRVNEICAAGQQELTLAFSAYAKKQGSGDNLVDAKLAPGIVTVLVPALQKQNEEIETLGAPQGDKDEIEAFLAARQAVLTKAKQDPPATIFKFGDGFRKSPNKLASKYGLDGCVY
jgi:hypothetical protein